MRRCGAVLFVIFCWASFSGCNGKDCTDKPTVEKHNKKSYELVEGFLDEADPYKRQLARAKELNDSLDPDRVVLFKNHEKLRSKMIAELTSAKPNRKRFHKLIDDISNVWMSYTMKTLDVTMDMHKMFTDEQRMALADAADKPAKKTKTFLLNQGIKIALFKISASDSQRDMVWKLRDSLVADLDRMNKKRNKVVKSMLSLWRKRDLDRDGVKAASKKIGAMITGFSHTFADGLFDVLSTLDKDQRTFTDSQVNRMNRCVEG